MLLERVTLGDKNRSKREQVRKRHDGQDAGRDLHDEQTKFINK